MRGRQHGKIDLEHRAERVVVAMQRREQLRRGFRELRLVRLQLADGGDVASRQLLLLALERHRLADLAGANEFGLALDQSEQGAHRIHQVFGELARRSAAGRGVGALGLHRLT